jgi:hypothetical protein
MSREDGGELANDDTETTCDFHGKRCRRNTIMQRNDEEKHIQSSPIDFAFMTALPIERDALLRRLERREVVQDDFEPLTYYRGPRPH